VRRISLLRNSEKQKEEKKKRSSNPTVRKRHFFRFWLKGIVRRDFKIT
jgi:hypothetical protein